MRRSDGLDAMRRSSETPFDPDENPRQDSGDDAETVHLGVSPKSRKVPVLAIHVLPPV